MMAEKLKWTGERVLASLIDQTATEHLHRYKLAMGVATGKRVLDIACGEGYGSAFLSTVALDVVGVDIDPDVIAHAIGKYNRSNLRFLRGSCSSIPIPDSSVDLVVSFETIEHHDEHDQMLQEIKRVLAPDGLLLISTPDKTVYSDKREFTNSFHKKELTRDEFFDLLARYFTHIDMYGQKMCHGSLIFPVMGNEELPRVFKFYCGDYVQMNDFEPDPLYYLAVAGDSVIAKADSSFFDGQIVFDDQIRAILNSHSYRLGYSLLKPFRLLKRILG